MTLLRGRTVGRAGAPAVGGHTRARRPAGGDGKLSRPWRIGSWVGFSIAGACLIGYANLVWRVVRPFAHIRTHFLESLLPIAAVHIAGLLVLRFLAGPAAARAAPYWAFSAGALVFIGGLRSFTALVGLVAFAVSALAIGRWLSKSVLPEEARSWAVHLAAGIAFTSFVGTGLAAAHVFGSATLIVILGAATTVATLANGKELVGSTRKWFQRATTAEWGWPSLIGYEGLFLLATFTWVNASAPERMSDAMRVYLPYARMLNRFHELPTLPSQWAFIVPQAGLAFAGSIYSLFGSVALRYAMLLALLALTGMVCSRNRKADCVPSCAVGLLVASCPLILITTLSLMQDTFVSLMVILLALVCIEGKGAGGYPFWIGLGALAGLSWCAKYTTVVYCGPLILIAVWRSWRAVGPRRTVRGSLAGSASALVTAGPWLWNASRQSGDPFFPFIRGLFPAPLWPHGVVANLDRFRLLSGIRGWLAWPYDMTYNSNKFVEGYPGILGLTLLILLLLAVYEMVWLRERRYYLWAATAVLGTALLWTQTVYIRYWLPGLWLLAPVAAAGLQRIGAMPVKRILLAAAALVILGLQAPLSLLRDGDNPQGWAWRYYCGKVTDDSFGSRYPGFAALSKLKEEDPDWPRVWFSGAVPVCYFDVVPLEAAVWQFRLHGLKDEDPGGMIWFLESAGCDYWAVNEAKPDAKLFKKLGVGDYFWKPEFLVARDGPVSIYRMPGSERARRAMESYVRRKGTSPASP